jgi:hypothetical protein
MTERPAQAAGGHAAAEAWVAEFAAAWRAPGTPDAFADRFEPIIHPDIRLVQPQMPTLVGKRAFRHGFVYPLFAFIPDLHGEVERYAVGDGVAYIELTLRGTLGGRPISWRGVDRVTLSDGLAVERVHYTDPLPFVRAVLTRPKAWPRFLSARGRTLVHRLKRRQDK